MAIFGKIFGGMFGSLIGGPIGLIIGIAVGHLFDRGLELSARTDSQEATFAQKVFFSTTFEMMGYIAKADGRISENEIQMARNVMNRLQLNHEQKLMAIKYFNLGKSPQFNWDSTMDNFIRNCGQHPQLVQLFFEIQIQAAYADGHQNSYKHNALERLCLKLGIPSFIFSKMESGFYSRGYQGRQQYRAQPERPPQDELADAYLLLGITAKATNAEIKRAYRQSMSQNHPDKLVAKGLPEEMIKIATEKTQKIQKAYELICRARGI